jgi:NAD(P)H-dependent flavin oxidoreductase YrpB (nitropropane dioxygenase family)
VRWLREYAYAGDLLGIEYPIFAAGMGSVTMALLTVAVSAAGGCGVLGATFCTPDELRDEIRAVRKIIDRPFGVDLLIPGDIPDFLSDLLPKVKGL